MALIARQNYYVVRRGDTLWAIAERTYGDPLLWPQIAAANSIPDGNLILIGMKLRLPPLALKNTDRYLKRPSRSPSMPVKAQLCTIANPGTSPTGAADTKTSSPAQKQSSGIRGSGSKTPFWHSPLQFPKARPVAYPAIKYELDLWPPVTRSLPNADITIRFKGELTVQLMKTLATLSFSKSGEVSAELKSEYDTEVSKLANQIKIAWDDAGKPELSFGFTLGSKINGSEFMSQSVSFIPPNRFVYTLSPHEISGSIDNMEFVGNVGFEIEIATKTSPPTSPMPLAVPTGQYAPRSTLDPIPWGDYKPSPVWIWAGVAVGAAIIVLDTLKNVGTLGAGMVESPVSYAAAFALFSAAGLMDEEPPSGEKR